MYAMISKMYTNIKPLPSINTLITINISKKIDNDYNYCKLSYLD